jgi:hypothetical protein
MTTSFSFFSSVAAGGVAVVVVEVVAAEAAFVSAQVDWDESKIARRVMVALIKCS